MYGWIDIGGETRPMARSKVQVLLDDRELTPELRGTIEHYDADITLESFRHNHSDNGLNHHARLVLTRDGKSMTNGKLSRLLSWFDRDPCVTLVASDLPVTDEAAVTAAVRDRAIQFVSGISSEELAQRLQALCTTYDTYEAMRRQLVELRHRDEDLLSSLEALRAELRLAGRIQRDLLRGPLPKLLGARIEFLHRPAAEVSGDVFQALRINEHRIGLFLADATGHGFAAGLLSAFVERSFVRHVQRAGEVGSIDEGAILSRINSDLLAADLKECHFVTALLATYDEGDRVFRWARAGAPYPVLNQPSRSVRALHSEGMLLGVRADALFESRSLRLAAGDSITIHTDGVEPVMLAEIVAEINARPPRVVTQSAHEADDISVVTLHVE